ILCHPPARSSCSGIDPLPGENADAVLLSLVLLHSAKPSPYKRFYGFQSDSEQYTSNVRSSPTIPTIFSLGSLQSLLRPLPTRIILTMQPWVTLGLANRHMVLMHSSQSTRMRSARSMISMTLARAEIASASTLRAKVTSFPHFGSLILFRIDLVDVEFNARGIVSRI